MLFRSLDSNDLVLGPAEDGGFYLIGARRFQPRLFAEVEWGSERVLEQTMANARALSFSAAALEPFYDLDRWEDLVRLAERAPRTRALLRQWL